MGSDIAKNEVIKKADDSQRKKKMGWFVFSSRE